LADEYRKINKNVLVLKNCVDPDDWPTPKRNEGEKVRIGLVGSVTANGDFDSIRVALTELNKRADVQLVMFGLPPKDLPKAQELYKEEYEFWSQFNIEWQPFVPMADYFDTLNNLRLDMMLIPRKDNYFNRCKSNIKFLEASMLEIPCVMQGFEDGKSPYQFDKVEEQGMGIVVTDNSKWLEAIDKLIANKDLRRAMGKLANKYVLENYDIKTNAINWKNAYENL
jgi:glycosyltransferase involved in cell wall biosynthesis